MSIDPGKFNIGSEYHFRVITYIAACLSENRDVRDFHICANQEIPAFEDVIIKVWYNSKTNPYVYFGQIKHKTTRMIHSNFEKRALDSYREQISKIIDKTRQIEKKNETIESINKLIETHNKIILNKNGTVEDRNKIIEHKNKIIDDKMKIIEEILNINNAESKLVKKHVRNKNTAIEEKNKILQDGSLSIEERNKIINEKNCIIDIVNKNQINDFILKVPNENIEYWFFCNNYTLPKKELEVGNIKCHIIKLEKEVYDSIFLFSGKAACYKLEPKVTQEPGMEEKEFFDKYRLFLNQPNNNEIIEHISNVNEEVYIKRTTNQVTDYIREYFKVWGCKYLSKAIFEIEILRLSLSKYIISPIASIEMHDNLVHIWNVLTLEYDLTIVDEDSIDMKRYLFAWLYQTLGRLLECNYNWNDFINRIPTNVLRDTKFKELTRKQHAAHWLAIPDTLDALLTEMWKCDYLPLILSKDCSISILEKYQHLKKKFVVLDKNDEIINKIVKTNFKIFTSLSDIRDNETLLSRKKLLEGIIVSLQGRKPIALINIINEDSTLMEKIKCSHMLRLMKKSFRLYIEQRYVQDVHSMIFIVEDDSNSREANVAFDNKFKNDSSPNNRPLYHLKRLHSNKKLEILKKGDSCINGLVTDEDGNSMFFDNERPIPVIGARVNREQDEYIPRSLQKAIIQTSFFNCTEKRICFFVGDVNSLETSIKGRIIKDTTDNIDKQIQSKLEKNEAVYIAIEDKCVESYWSKFSSNKYPLFQIRVINGTMIMVKYKNDQNVSSHILYEGHTFEEDSFFEEITNAITIVTGEPGMGKTSLLHALFEKYDKQNYAIFCDLVDCRADLEKDNNELYEYPLEYVIRRFENSTICNSRRLLDVDFLNSLCKFHQSNNRLLVFLDSLDEIFPACKTQVLKFINALAKSNTRMIIASRLISDNLLSNDFEVQPIKLAGLAEHAAKEYLKNKQVSYADIQKIPIVLLENPLYLKFFVTLFKKNSSVFSSNNICNLCEEIITEKIVIWLKKMTSSNNKSYHQREDILKEHKLLALTVVFGKKIIIDQKLNYDALKKKCIDTNKVKVGIIVRFSEDYPIFVQQIFAEYLAAEWLAENIDESFAKDLYLEISTPNKIHLKYIFDTILCRNLELHTAVLNQDLEQVEYLCRNGHDIQQVDKCGRTVLHLVASALSVEDTDKHSRRNSSTNLKILNAIIKRMPKHENSVNELLDKFMKKTWWDMLMQSSYSVYDQLLKDMSHLGLTNTLEKCLEHIGQTIMKKDIAFNIKYNFPVAMSQLKKDASLVTCHYHSVVNRAIHLNQLNSILDLVKLQKQNLLMTGFDDLHINCISGNIRKMQDLIHSGADVNALDDFQNICLHYGVLTNSRDMLSVLIHHTLDINTKGINGNTPLHFAAKFSEKDVVLFLLSQSQIKINCTNNSSETALHIAAKKVRTDIVNILLKRGADANLRNAEGETALHIAVRSDQDDIVKLLLELNIQTDIIDNFSNNALHIAAEIGNKDIVEMLMIKSANVNLKNNHGNTALQVAVINEKIQVIQKLLDNNADINNQNYRGRTPLLEAVENRNIVIVDLLLRQNAKVNLVSYRNESALYLAVDRCDEGIIEILLENGADVNYQQYHSSETVFDIALQRGNVNIIELLIRSPTLTDRTLKRCLTSCILHTKKLDILKLILEKCDAMHTNDRLHTFLQKVSSSEFGEAIALLLKYGVNIKSKYSNYSNVSRPAIEKIDVKCANMLPKSLANVSHGNENTIDLNMAGKEQNGNELNRSLHNEINVDIEKKHERIVDVTYITDSEFSVLHRAAATGNMKMLKLLLENGTNIVLDMRNKYDASLLHIAIEKESEDVVKLLLERGANPNFVDYYYYDDNKNDVWDVVAKQDKHIEPGNISALCMAIKKRNKTIVRMLIESKVDVNVYFNEIPLQVAIRHKYSDLVKLLLENGADVNVGTRKDSRHHISKEENLSAMQTAVQMKSIEIIEILLKHGIHVDTFHHGKTALELACSNGDMETAKFLLDNGANVNFRRPLYWAVTHGHEKVVKLLLDRIDYGTVLNDIHQNLLNIAVKTQKINIINMLIAKGIRLNIQDEDSNTPLSNAIYLRRLDIVNLLLDKGANINYRHRYGETALHIATRHQSINIIKTLLRRGANTTYRNKDGDTALRTAIGVGTLYGVITLLRYDMEIALFIRKLRFPLLLLSSLLLHLIFFVRFW